MNRFFTYALPRWFKLLKQFKLFGYYTWTEQAKVKCEHYQICEITSLIFVILGFEITISSKWFPRKLFNYWKFYATSK